MIQFARIKALLTSNRAIVNGIKYIPLVSTILLTIHVGFLLLGIYEPFTVGVSAILLVLLLVLLSVKFSFCMLHRSMILFMAVMTLCICANKVALFGRALTVVRLVLFAIGVALVALSVFKRCGDDK